MRPELRSAVARVTGACPVRWTPRYVGYAANERWSVELDDGRRVFVKHGVADNLADFLRREHRFYRDVSAPFTPRLVGFDDEGEWPALVLEDLSDGEWSWRWTDERVTAVRATLDELHALRPPEWLPPPGDRIWSLAAATTSASRAVARSSSTGTSRATAPRASTSRPGCRACTPRAARRRGSCSPASRSTPRYSRASSAAAPDSRR